MPSLRATFPNRCFVSSINGIILGTKYQVLPYKKPLPTANSTVPNFGANHFESSNFTCFQPQACFLESNFSPGPAA